jgi:hypothetical protein
VALAGQTLSDLPPSLVQVFGQGRRTGVQTVSGAVVARQPTEWVLQGQESVRIVVTRNKRSASAE